MSDYQLDFERDGKTHRICVRHHEVKGGVIQPYAAWDATEQDLRRAGFVLVNGADVAASDASYADLAAEYHALCDELEAVRLERDRARAELGEICVAATVRPGEEWHGRPSASCDAVASILAERDRLDSQLTTERDRAEEAERLVRHHRLVSEARLRCIKRLDEELAAVNARVARLEEASRLVLDQYGFGEGETPPMHERNAISVLNGVMEALSAAPQASTEQVEHEAYEPYDRGASPIPQVAQASAHQSADRPVMLSELVRALRGLHRYEIESGWSADQALESLAGELERGGK